MAKFHTFKTRDGHATKALTPVKAIRNKCLDCCCWAESEVKKCDIDDCALYPFRMGKRPTE